MKKYFLIPLFIICFFSTIFAQYAFRKEIDFSGTSVGIIEHANQIGPNQILMTFQDYIYVVDTNLNVLHRFQAFGIPNMGYPKLGSVKVKDGVIIAYTDQSNSNMQIYKFSNDFSSILYQKTYNFGTYGVQPTFDMNFWVQDTTIKSATFVGAISSCNEASVIANFDSALNINFANQIINFGGVPFKNHVDADKLINSFYLMSRETQGGTSIVKTDLYANALLGFYIYVGDSLTHGKRLIKTSDNHLLISGMAWNIGSPDPVQFLLKCDTTGNAVWCKTYSVPGYKLDYYNGLFDMGGKYYAAGSIGPDSTIDTDGLILEINNNGTLNNYKAYTEIFSPNPNITDRVANIVKVNNKQIVVEWDGVQPRFFYSNNPLQSESCASNKYNISATNLTPTLTVIPNNNFVTQSVSPLIGYNSTVNFINKSYPIITPCTSPLTISDIVEKDTLFVYPNPVQNTFILISNEKIDDVRILNTMGQLIGVKITRNELNTKLDVSILSPGIYFVMVYANNKITTKKFVKE